MVAATSGTLIRLCMVCITSVDFCSEPAILRMAKMSCYFYIHTEYRYKFYELTQLIFHLHLYGVQVRFGRY